MLEPMISQMVEGSQFEAVQEIAAPQGLENYLIQ